MYIIDLHQDLSDTALILTHADFFTENKLHDGWNDLGLGVNNQTDFPRLKKGKVKVIFGSACVFDFENGDVIRAKNPVSDTFRHLEYYQSLVNKKPKNIQFLKTKKDLKNIEKFDLNILLHIENASVLEEGLFYLDPLFEIGVRSIGLTWNHKNKFASGPRAEGGLTTEGKKLIKLMNHKGIIVDLAHLNEQSFFDVLKAIKKPPVYSHANCKDLNNHLRNITDKQMKALAKSGGVFGMSAVAPFIGGKETIYDFINHILHAIEIMGINHVAIGTDFGGMTVDHLTEGLEDVTTLPHLLKLLKKSGLSETDIEKITNKNALRVIKQNIP